MKISVIIPAYNAERFVADAIESCLSQSYAPHEIIVVDDGSSDRTFEVSSSFAPPVRVIQIKENIGVAGARNRGIESALGDWVAFLDADDRFLPTKLERQMNRAQPNTVLLYSGLWTTDKDGVRRAVFAADPADVLKGFRYLNPIATSTVLAQRCAILQCGGFREDVAVGEDWDLWIRLSRLGQINAVQDPLTEYFLRPGSASSDPQEHLEGVQRIMESTLLWGLRGPSRWCWRRRILSYQMASATYRSRRDNPSAAAALVLRSLLTWPSPFWRPRRFGMLGAIALEQYRTGVKL